MDAAPIGSCGEGVTYGVDIEEYPGSVDSIMDIEGNYPNMGSGERATWFRDGEGNLLGVAQVIPSAFALISNRLRQIIAAAWRRTVASRCPAWHSWLCSSDNVLR